MGRICQGGLGVKGDAYNYWFVENLKACLVASQAGIVSLHQPADRHHPSGLAAARQPAGVCG